VMVTN